MADTLAWDLLTGLAAGLQAELEVSGLQEPCFLGILPGQGVAYDYCAPCGTDGKCGMAWVRLALMTPVVDIRAGTRCGGTFTTSVEMGILRCHQTITSDRNPAPMGMAYQEGKAQDQVAEMEAMMRVLLCSELMKKREVTLDAYSPIGPEGGCVGGAWVASIGPS